MAWYNVIGDWLKPAKDIVQTFKESEENKGERHHEEQMADVKRDLAVLGQFSAEFQRRENRTWWDSLVDGLNRLPRPLLTIGILSFFVLAPLDPAKFLEIAKAYEMMPNGFWALLSIIIGFYFGGRMQVKQQDMVIKAGHVQAAKDLVAMRKEFRELDREDEPPTEGDYQQAQAKGLAPSKNKVVAEWRRKHGKG